MSSFPLFPKFQMAPESETEWTVSVSVSAPLSLNIQSFQIIFENNSNCARSEANQWESARASRELRSACWCAIFLWPQSISRKILYFSFRCGFRWDLKGMLKLLAKIGRFGVSEQACQVSSQWAKCIVDQQRPLSFNFCSGRQQQQSHVQCQQQFPKPWEDCRTASSCKVSVFLCGSIHSILCYHMEARHGFGINDGSGHRILPRFWREILF